MSQAGTLHPDETTAGDQQQKISKLTVTEWQQGCRISHMLFVFLLAQKENKNIFQNTREKRPCIATLLNPYGD